MTDVDSRFPYLMAPGRIGSLELRNRIVMCPMGVLFGNEDGSVSDNEAAFYEARARGGAGLLIIGTACVAYPRGTNHPRMPGVSDDKFLPGMIDLAQRVHKHGSRVAAQLNFMGVYSYVDMLAGRKRLVPYVPANPQPDHVSAMVTAQEMADMSAPFVAQGTEFRYHVAGEDDIAWVIERYADAADRCRRAGYDGVELHAGHGYFIDEFLSPRNSRTDRWGGDIEGRARLLVEITRAVRARVGVDYPVWMRINAVERHHRIGEQFEEQRQAITLAVEAGIDAVHLTAYANTDVAQAATDSYAPHVVGPLADYAADVRTAVNVPVITFGRFEPDEAEAVLSGGKADFVAMGRKLLADPDLPGKLAAGRVDDIRPCIYQYKCIGNIALRTPARCVVNPATGREHDLRIEPASRQRSVLVVGGGPAGLDAARLLAERGHRVTLREASTRLGGMLIAAAAADPLLGSYLGWLIHQVERAAISLELGRPVTAQDSADGFDEVVVATGATWGTPDVPGDRSRVRSLGEISGWLHDDGDEIGTNIAILGESKAALSLAELCLRRGRKPTVIGRYGYFAPELGLPGRYRMISELAAAGVRLLANTTIDLVTDEGVQVGSELIAADTIVGIAPAAPASTLQLAGIRVHTIGDCHDIGYLEGATSAALAVARSIN